MAFITRQVTRTSQPQELVGPDYSNEFSGRLIDLVLGNSAATLSGQPISRYGNLSGKPYAGGIGLSGAANSGASFPAAYKGTTAITLVFEFVQNSRSGTQILLESSANVNTNAGSFVVYTDAAADRLYFRQTFSSGGSFDAGYVSLPALGAKTSIAIRLQFTAGTGTAHIGIAVNGVNVAPTITNTSSGVVSFADYTTYLLSRAGTSFQADATIGLYSVFSGFFSDRQLASLSANPWQIFEPINEVLWVPDAVSGGGVQNLAASGTAQATATADLSKGVFLAAAALSVASGTAGMSLSVPLAASATGQASSSGQISLTVTFAANAVATALATADLTLAKPLAASAAGQATGTAALDVVAAGGTVNLAATAQAQATGSAALSLAINLSAAAVAQATATAALGGSAALAAAAIANAQATAALAVGKPLSGAAQAQASAGATLWLDVPLSAAALAQAAAGGALSLTVNLAAAAVSTATAGASLPSEVLLSASGAAVATSTATLMVMGGMDSSINRPFVIRQTHRSWSKKQTARSWLAAQTSRY